MTSDLLRTASQLSQAIRASRDPLRTLSSVLGILAQGCDHDEMCNDLDRAAADAKTYAEMRDEAAEAKRAGLEEYALALMEAEDKRDAWINERRDAA